MGREPDGSGAAVGQTAKRPLWTCPSCGHPFASRNLWHSCVQVPIDEHFAGRPRARELYDAFLAAVQETGLVHVASSRTRISFVARVRFAGVEVRRDYLRAGLWLKRRVDLPRLRQELIPPGEWITQIVLRDEADIDDELRAWIREARVIGEQDHPTQRRAGRRAARPRGSPDRP